MPDADGLTTYASYRLWKEDAWEYWDFVENCSRSGIDPASLDDRPLSILRAIRRM